MHKLGKSIGLFILLGLIFNISFTYAADDAAANLKKANESIMQAIDLVKLDDVQGAKDQYERFRTQWLELEDGVKEKSKQTYKEIEDAMGQIEFAFLQQPANPDRLIEALTNQSQINQQFIDGKYPAEEQSKGDATIRLPAVVDTLRQANQYLQQGDTAKAKEEIEKFRESWLDVEGIVLTQSAKVYADAERDMVLTYAYLSNGTKQVDEAKQTIDNMIKYLEPLASKTNYNMLDAVTIILREGLEALLVVVALLAYLKKSGHSEKKKWIWSGVAGGIGVSLILGIIVKLLFSSGAFGNNNFLIAGFTGIFAAVMLLYMTYWLHSNASIHRWNHFIKTKSSNALASGSLWSLAILSFLAVFREGTETVLFLIGMASSISLGDLLLGIGIALAVLIAAAYLMLRYGMKIPVRPFFLISSILVFYLCFKFTGTGVHGLQLSGLIPATHLEGFKSIELLAVYPTLQGLYPQLLLIVAAVGIIIWNKVRDLRLQKKLEIENA